MTRHYLSRRGLLATTLAAVLAPRSALAESATVTIDELKASLAHQGAILIDVREADEFAAGHIPGASLMPLSTFDPAQLPKAEGKRVILYCRSGRRAKEAAALAEQAGRGDVAVYAGSMNEWLAAGEPVEK
jgi:rhodanese-related sulfurtransferase